MITALELLGSIFFLGLLMVLGIISLIVTWSVGK